MREDEKMGIQLIGTVPAKALPSKRNLIQLHQKQLLLTPPLQHPEPNQ
jgi:hypothetical protein